MTLTTFKQFASLAALATTLAACSTFDRLEHIGQPPSMAPLTNPLVSRANEALPVTPPPEPVHQDNSLWSTGAHSFFHDPRASHRGDILTVDISIADAAKISDTTARSRANSDNANLTNFFGLEGPLASALPSGANPASLVKMGSDLSNSGTGSVDRSETINLTLAAIVTQVLPNGNLVIDGHQQVRVNNELRDLHVSGIVRREDISQQNTVNLSQIAEARITYGGQGTVSDVQQPRYGSQLFDILMPW
ncbi:MAG: flagellar basal body L-ring protein FlgH [Alphaproteobacteria bacterium]|nr:flagellar basal body L-ring protein FlgH [Alphaproteobacteria bacterium]